MDASVAVTRLSMICGTAVRMVVMILGSAVIREVISWKPVWMIWGMEPRKKSMTELTMVGNAAISTGRASSVPVVRPVIS